MAGRYKLKGIRTGFKSAKARARFKAAQKSRRRRRR